MENNYKDLKSIPLDIGKIHFVGIGGIGMSGIAEILHNMGYKVSGSDLSENGNVKRLRGLGIEVFKGHDANNVIGASVVVKSTAVSFINDEIREARERYIPVVRRSEMLAELTKLKSTIAVAGSHGKTTTTSILAQILTEAKLEPTVINGGVINSFGSNAKLGMGDWLVAEADESDGTFIKIPATVGIITNIDPEHMDYWKEESKIYEAFEKFVSRLPFYGFAVLNYDHPKVRELANKTKDGRIYTYSMDKENQISCVKLLSIDRTENYTKFRAKIGKEISNLEEDVEADFHIPAFGEHNISNSLAAIIASLGIGIKIADIQEALKNFEGVKRRFTILGELNGATIVDDYAHHPIEIEATLQAAKQYMQNSEGKIIAVMQPHRYTRLEDLFDEFSNCFTDADKVIITEMYSAGEKPINNVDQFSLARSVSRKNIDVTALEDDKTLKDAILEVANKGDLVICMGAGTITNYAANLVE